MLLLIQLLLQPTMGREKSFLTYFTFALSNFISRLKKVVQQGEDVDKIYAYKKEEKIFQRKLIYDTLMKKEGFQ